MVLDAFLHDCRETLVSALRGYPLMSASAASDAQTRYNSEYSTRSIFVINVYFSSHKAK